MTGAMDGYDVGVTFQASEPVTFSLLYRDHPNYPIKDDWRMLTALAENQNVSFEIVNVPLSDWADRRSLLIAAGDIPDMIPSTHIRDAQNYTAGGALLPIGNYLEYLPNFQQKIADWDLEDELQEMAYEADGLSARRRAGAIPPGCPTTGMRGSTATPEPRTSTVT